MRTTRRRRIVRLVLFVLPLFFLVLAGLIWLCRELWNGLMPPIFGLRAITYWQALGLMVLSWILFRGFRGPHPGYGGWRYNMRRRWERMTPAEREEFIRGLNTRCGSPPPASPGPPPAP
jgi:Ca2+/H+ antiporter, TMEM165/GDT1 family